MNRITVHVPGSTSNCGAGFDTLGLALQIYNQVEMTEIDSDTPRPVEDSDGCAAKMVDRVIAEFSAETGRSAPGFSYRFSGDVPISRGLGSSVTVLAGVLAGINFWAGSPLSTWDIARVLTRIEGHPDNATAGALGGFCVSRIGASAGELVDLVRTELPDMLKFVVASSEVEIATKGSRAQLPEQLEFGEGVRSMNSATFLTAAFLSGDFDRLKGAAEDYLHEPYRLPGIPGGAETIRAGIAAGALTGWLSGSGSSVLCVAMGESGDAVAAAMESSFSAHGQASTVRVLAADNAGLKVQSSES